VNQIKKFETLNDISIFINEKGIVPIRQPKEEQTRKPLVHGGQRGIFCAHRESKLSISQLTTYQKRI